jgi:hypothetical protein
MSKNAVDILSTVIDFLQGSETFVKIVLDRVDMLEDAAPWLALGFVGLRYCKQLLSALGDPEAVQQLLKSSPKELWADAGDVETEIAIIKASQLKMVEDS